MKKQTAVEWLISKLQQSKDWQRVLNEVSQMSTVQFNLLEQAKEMEKQQIIDAANTLLYPGPGPGDTWAEQYYNETYNK